MREKKPEICIRYLEPNWKIYIINNLKHDNSGRGRGKSQSERKTGESLARGATLLSKSRGGGIWAVKTMCRLSS